MTQEREKHQISGFKIIRKVRQYLSSQRLHKRILSKRSYEFTINDHVSKINLQISYNTIFLSIVSVKDKKEFRILPNVEQCHEYILSAQWKKKIDMDEREDGIEGWGCII